MKIWLTSDWHIGHNKDFIFEPRGFKTVDEMNSEILKRHNEIVSPEDTVYILGDCAVGGPATAEVIDFLNKFNGHKYLAFGNHDSSTKLKAYEDAGIFEDIQMGYRMKYKKMGFILTHYPTIVANGDNSQPVYGLFGHTHQITNFYEHNYKMYHVGVDSHDCYPILLDDIITEISTVKNDPSFVFC